MDRWIGVERAVVLLRMLGSEYEGQRKFACAVAFGCGSWPFVLVPRCALAGIHPIDAATGAIGRAADGVCWFRARRSCTDRLGIAQLSSASSGPTTATLNQSSPASLRRTTSPAAMPLQPDFD